jgi:hypothetical protein
MNSNISIMDRSISGKRLTITLIDTLPQRMKCKRQAVGFKILLKAIAAQQIRLQYLTRQI